MITVRVTLERSITLLKALGVERKTSNKIRLRRIANIEQRENPDSPGHKIPVKENIKG